LSWYVPNFTTSIQSSLFHKTDTLRFSTMYQISLYLGPM
jgi:hypothetical protein